MSVLFLVGCGSSEASDEIKAERLANKQNETAIVLAQWALKDEGFNDYDGGTKHWNVAQQETEEKTYWIVTSQDSNYGRIKYIGHWDGNTEALRYEHVYLLVGGNEIYNKR